MERAVPQVRAEDVNLALVDDGVEIRDVVIEPPVLLGVRNGGVGEEDARLVPSSAAVL